MSHLTRPYGYEPSVKLSSKKTTAKTKGTVCVYPKDGSSGANSNLTMQLMGLPYQFLDTVDMRVPGVSKNIGRSYMQNIMLNAPILTIIPGKPKYLPGTKDKAGMTNALIDAASGKFGPLKSLNPSGEQVKLYDFQTDYLEFMGYVNMMNRGAAAFMDLGYNSDAAYKINGKDVNFLSFDWKHYRWNGQNYRSMTGEILQDVAKKGFWKTFKGFFSGIVGGLTGKKLVTDDPDAAHEEEAREAMENSFKRINYIQFYTDIEASNSNESISNSTQQSVLKQAVDQATSAVRDVAFLMDTGAGGAGEGFQNLGDSLITSLESVLGVNAGADINTQAGNIVSRLLSSGKSIIKGENLILPDIYGGSQRGKEYSVSLHFKAPYGNRLAVYTDVIVPVNFCICLAYPHARNANSFGSPYILKCYQKGGWTCQLGMISSIQITKNVAQSARSVDGLCLEVDVQMSITDMYADMALTPPNDPVLFLCNDTLVEYMATTCGLDLIQPQLDTKIRFLWNSVKNIVKDYPTTAIGSVTEKIDEFIIGFTGL